MKYVYIRRNGTLLNRADFNTSEEAQIWLQQIEQSQKFGEASSYDIEIIDMSQELSDEYEMKISQKYLSDTDWYIVREMDSGEPCPQEIKIARAAARLKL